MEFIAVLYIMTPYTEPTTFYIWSYINESCVDTKVMKIL